MKKIDITFETPRGNFKMHTIFDNMEEARKHGWGLWFQHHEYLILGKDNHIGAIVKVS